MARTRFRQRVGEREREREEVKNGVLQTGAHFSFARKLDEMERLKGGVGILSESFCELSFCYLL